VHLYEVTGDFDVVALVSTEGIDELRMSSRKE
jgi:hypothetical protein